jgi:acetyl esterase/lipase
VLAVYHPAKPGRLRPAVLQIHGGAWVLGSRRDQGLPLLYHLASHGWVGFNVDYRLSPAATFPDHLIDIKRALAWIREHAEEYGVDPGFVVVTGGSAGGHLTALMALTQNDPAYQPGFETADTSVQAAVPFYGVYCFVDRLKLYPREFFTMLLEPWVMKVKLAEAPEKFHEASPLDRVGADAPPFFVIHGDRDTLAPVQYARELVRLLRERSRSLVAYAELPGAQHAFDVFYSPRSVRVVEGVERFLSRVHQRHVQGQASA